MVPAQHAIELTETANVHGKGTVWNNHFRLSWSSERHDPNYTNYLEVYHWNIVQMLASGISINLYEDHSFFPYHLLYSPAPGEYNPAGSLKHRLETKQMKK